VAALVLVTLAALAWGTPAFCDQIHEAAGHGDLEKVKALLKDNPNLVFSKDKDHGGATPLHIAAVLGHRDVAKLLLANHADVNAKDNNGVTALYYAAYSGHKDVVELLLANHADVNAKDYNGMTPLQAAAIGDQKDIAELLRQNGAREETARSDGRAPPLTSGRLWTDSEFEKGKQLMRQLAESLGPVVSREITINIAPPFYKGSLPLEFQDRVIERHGFAANFQVTFIMNFGEWYNQFIYLDLDTKNYALANGARSIELPTGLVLAEAKLIDSFIGTDKPAVVEEWHYDKQGRVIFKRKSYFDIGTGCKVSETKSFGVKDKEYFFIWDRANPR
jgi:hypothetical protein